MTLHDFLEQSTATIPSNKHAGDVRRELLSHVLLKADEWEASGLDPTDAVDAALKSMGDPAIIAQDYLVPQTRIQLGWALLGGIPLLIAAMAAINTPSNILAWLIVLGTIAVIVEPGATLAARLGRMWNTMQTSPLILAAGAASGLAAALYTVNIGGPLSMLFEFFGPWLAVLYCCWQRSNERPATPFSMVWVSNAAFWAIGGSAYLLLRAASPHPYYSSSMVNIGLAVTVSIWALAYAWEGVQGLRRRDTRLARTRRQTTLKAAAPDDVS